MGGVDGVIVAEVEEVLLRWNYQDRLFQRRAMIPRFCATVMSTRLSNEAIVDLVQGNVMCRLSWYFVEGLRLLCTLWSLMIGEQGRVLNSRCFRRPADRLGRIAFCRVLGGRVTLVYVGASGLRCDE